MQTKAEIQAEYRAKIADFIRTVANRTLANPELGYAQKLVATAHLALADSIDTYPLDQEIVQ